MSPTPGTRDGTTPTYSVWLENSQIEMPMPISMATERPWSPLPPTCAPQPTERPWSPPPPTRAPPSPPNVRGPPPPPPARPRVP
jgi:hypothetical protein